MPNLVGLSWDQAAGLIARATARGLVRRDQYPVHYVGVDETSHLKGHPYDRLRHPDHFNDWYQWARRSQVEPIKKVALMIKTR